MNHIPPAMALTMGAPKGFAFGASNYQKQSPYNSTAIARIQGGGGKLDLRQTEYGVNFLYKV